MKNIEEVRAELCQAFGDLRFGELEVKKAAELSNMVGKIVNTLKVELEYAHLRKEKPDIAFMKNL